MIARLHGRSRLDSYGAHSRQRADGAERARGSDQRRPCTGRAAPTRIIDDRPQASLEPMRRGHADREARRAKHACGVEQMPGVVLRTHAASEDEIVARELALHPQPRHGPPDEWRRPVERGGNRRE